MRAGVQVKLLPQDGEVYVLARSDVRVDKERALRHKKLRRRLTRRHELRKQLPDRDQLLMALGAAKKETGRFYALLSITVPAADQAVRAETFPFRFDRPRRRVVRRREGRYLRRSNLTGKTPGEWWRYYSLQPTRHQTSFMHHGRDLRSHRLSWRCHLVLIDRVNWNLSFGLAAASVILAACDSHPPAQPPTAPATTNAAPRQVFRVIGTVIEVQAAEKIVEIQHEEIPGYMKSMTMPFDVKNTNELTGLGTGDKVTFQMIVLTNDAWIENIRVTEKSMKGVPTHGAIRVVREVEPLKVGDALPEYHFTNELGQAVSTTQFKGKAVVISFLFTRCPYPTFCPLMAGNLATAQRRLTALTNGPTNWQLLALTIDPGHDTPAVLREYGERFSYDPKSWSFLTGDLVDITALAEQFEMTFWHENGNQLPTHNLRTVVVDANGRIQSIVAGNKWTVDELVTGVVKAASARP